MAWCSVQHNWWSSERPSCCVMLIFTGNTLYPSYLRHILQFCYLQTYLTWSKRLLLISNSKFYVHTKENVLWNIIIIVIMNFLHGLGRLSCSGIGRLPSFSRVSTISSSSRFCSWGRVSGVWCCPFFQDGWSSSVCVWISRLVFQRSLVIFLWLRFLFCPVLCILQHFLESAPLQLLGESRLASWLPMFHCHRVVLV